MYQSNIYGRVTKRGGKPLARSNPLRGILPVTLASRAPPRFVHIAQTRASRGQIQKKNLQIQISTDSEEWPKRKNLAGELRSFFPRETSKAKMSSPFPKRAPLTVKKVITPQPVSLGTHRERCHLYLPRGRSMRSSRVSSPLELSSESNSTPLCKRKIYRAELIIFAQKTFSLVYRSQVDLAYIY